MTQTIRDLIQERRNEIGDATGLSPVRAAELLTEFANLTGNINDEIRAQEMLYNHKLMECYEVEASANRAKIRAQTTPHYQRLRELKDLKEVVEELKRSLKYFLRAYEHEMSGYRKV